MSIKHNPEKIIPIVKLSDGKIIFLEEGSAIACLFVNMIYADYCLI